MRRQFQLGIEDEACLNSSALIWEAIIENSAKWFILPGYSIPEGYDYRSADLALRIPPSYPDDQIDMVYFFPALKLTGGRVIRALTSFPLDGKQYQQWSRHRTAQNPWRPGIDNICTHLLLVDTWLARELRS